MLKASMKILVVDAQEFMRTSLKDNLHQVGFKNVIVADSGTDALAKLADVEFVIADWDIGEINGLELLTKIRSDAKTKTLPFLMVMAVADQAKVISAVKAGANNFLVKPFSIANIKEKIDKIFNPPKK